MSEKLRECPFCGSKNVLIQGYGNLGFYMECISCGCMSPNGETEEETIKAWNTRHQPKHETVERWEARTGEIYPDDAPVWAFSPCEQEWQLYMVKELEHTICEVMIVATHHGKPNNAINRYLSS